MSEKKMYATLGACGLSFIVGIVLGILIQGPIPECPGYDCPACSIQCPTFECPDCVQQVCAECPICEENIKELKIEVTKLEYCNSGLNAGYYCKSNEYLYTYPNGNCICKLKSE